jgi:succinyl-CoA synthetase beta subunit
MKIHEYQAKEIFAHYGIPIQEARLCHSVNEVANAVEVLGLPVVVKAQVLAGGRGKAGGIKFSAKKKMLLLQPRRYWGWKSKNLKLKNCWYVRRLI